MLSDRVYLAQIFVDHQLALQHYLHKSVGSRDDAQDLLQECFVRVMKNPKSLRSVENVRAYLFTIARNLTVDLFRRRSVQGYNKNIDSASLDQQGHALSPEHNLEWAQKLQRLKLCIQRMPTTTREVFLLSRFEEMTYPQIANALKISTRTVERRMRNAMALLSHSLEGYPLHE